MRAIAYVVYKETSDQKDFFNMLKSKGFEIRAKELKVHADSAKGNQDVEMAVDIMTIANKLDTIIMVSGDGDYTYLLETLKKQGLNVEIMAFEHSCSKELIQAANRFHQISEEMLIPMKEKK